MKKLLLGLFITFGALIGFTQIEISGNLTTTYVSIGGAPREQHIVPRIMPNHTFYLVKVDSIAKTHIAAEVTTDSLGNFKKILSAGLYYPSPTKELKIPEPINNRRIGMVHAIDWHINNRLFIQVDKTVFLQVNRHESNICYMCP